MSKNITIQEGGVARQFGGVAKLRTDQQGGGSVYWVPEEEVQLETKSITENGTYYAADDGVYGWDTINVNVPGGTGGDPGGIGSSIVGTDPDDGEEYYIGVDDNGELVKIKLPVRIEVTTPPTKTEYEDGETIDPTGIVVHAYYAGGSDYGAVPNSELSYEPETASGGSGGTWSGGSSAWVNFTYSPAPGYYYTSYERWVRTTEHVRLVLFVFPDDGTGHDPNYYDHSCRLFAVSGYARQSCWYAATSGKDSGPPSGNGTHKTLVELKVVDGVQYYGCYVNGFSVAKTGPKISYVAVGSSDDATLENAWRYAYGDGASTGGQTITVKWPRIRDQKVLTTTFDITVTESSAEGGGGGHSF